MTLDFTPKYKSTISSPMDEVYKKRFQQWIVPSEYLYLYTEGGKVWVPHPVEVWECAEIIQSYDGKSLQVLTDSGEQRTIHTTDHNELPPLKNPDILIGENDLTSLSYLHEPAVLYNLLVRFVYRSSIYTYCGIVLVAINPYEELPIYGNDTIWAYRGRALGELEPHIFAIAEEAFTRMESEKKNQSIIVSGESGAGKTVSAKYVMRYIATVSGSSKETQVEKKVLASSPIMEAFGNAKTTRNDNSSRFGKFIELHFNRNYEIVGASMRTYLLEKSRVIFQSTEERNYHIFYQLCASRNSFPEFKLETAEYYDYLPSECSIQGVDDEKTFKDTVNAMTMLGFSTNDQIDIFKVLASVLHLGNIKIIEAGRQDVDGSYILEDDKHLVCVAELLDLMKNDLRLWLCHRRIVSMKETFDLPMTVSEAMFARDALAKHMYARLFTWIVTKINKMLETGVDKHRFIGVLDIYGFETFQMNSFEQFCINYANEKLQQQFNLHVFKLDQEEYFKEGIEWKFIDFYDNQPCIDLIEMRLGILDLLDEECKMPRGSDGSWCEKLYTKCSKCPHFSKPRFGTTSFQVKHFADSVEYQVEGFLEKNRDTVIEEQVTVLAQSNNRLLQKLFGYEDEKKSRSNQHAATIGHSGRLKVPSSQAYSTATLGPSSAKKQQQIQHKKTVGFQFRESLSSLMTTLNSTTPHYIRCIKPNDSKAPFEYNPQRAVQQLRACGVLETIRISAAGFPSRVLYVDFYNRYKVLLKSEKNNFDLQTWCNRIVDSFIKDEDKYKYGKTKIFFRAGQVAYLERLRADRLKTCCILIQKTVRGYLAKHRYLQIRRAVLLLQRLSRGYLARRLVYHMRRARAAVTIQRYVKGWLKYRVYTSIRQSVLLLQAHGRGLLARKYFLGLKRNKAALVIQRNVRRWLCEVQYKRSQRSVIICQSAVRRFLAKRQLKELKKEARSVEHMKKLNNGLENKIISLQQKIGELQKELVPLKVASQELNEVRSKLDDFKIRDIEFQKLRTLFAEKEVEFENLKNILNKEQSEKENIINEKENIVSSYALRLQQVEEEKDKLLIDTEKLKEEFDASKQNMEEMIKSKIEHEKMILFREQDQSRDAYQKLLTEKNILESRVESLEKELLRNDQSAASSRYSHERSLSNASTISIQDLSHNSPNETNVNDKIDIGLVLKLQQKLKTLQFERDKLSQRIDTTERNYHQYRHNERVRDNIKIQELEIENEKLHKNLEQLRKAIACSVSCGENASNELMSQFHELETELARKIEECNQLRNVLYANNEGLKNVAKNNYSAEAEFQSINEDGELILAFEAQKKINRQLEEELQWEKSQRKEEQRELLEEISRLKDDNERQQQILSLNLTNSPKSQTELYLQSEIARLTTENLELRDKYELLYREYRKIKDHTKYATNGVQQIATTEESNLPIIVNNSEPPSLSSTVYAVEFELPAVRKKDGYYSGMFAFDKSEIMLILRYLLYDLQPSTVLELLPGLPSYIIFMCIRHTDITNDEERVRGFLSNFIGLMKKMIKKRQQDTEVCIMWLSNVVRLVNVLKQYGGDSIYQEESTPAQIAQCLQNFDLSEYHTPLTDMACMIYQNVIRIIEDQIQNLALTAILEYEALPGISGTKQLTRSQSVTSSVTTPVKETPVELQKRLTTVFNSLSLHGVDLPVIVQIFKQLFYFICATALNNLLLRRELCHWSKGIQIRFNLSHLEQWARDHNIQTPETHVVEELQPIIQAAQLLQARKTDADVNQICDMCSRMTSKQIIKLLNLYTPGDDYEERVSISFIKKVQEKLHGRAKADDQSHLLMDTKVIFPVRFSFTPSSIKLEDVEIPPSLNLPMLKKL